MKLPSLLLVASVAVFCVECSRQNFIEKKINKTPNDQHASSSELQVMDFNSKSGERAIDKPEFKFVVPKLQQYPDLFKRATSFSQIEQFFIFSELSFTETMVSKISSEKDDKKKLTHVTEFMNRLSGALCTPPTNNFSQLIKEAMKMLYEADYNNCLNLLKEKYPEYDHKWTTLNVIPPRDFNQFPDISSWIPRAPQNPESQ